METGLGFFALNQTRFDAIKTRLGHLLKFVSIKWIIFDPVFLFGYRTGVVVRQVGIVFDLLVKVFFVDSLQKGANADTRKLQELGVLAVGR